MDETLGGSLPPLRRVQWAARQKARAVAARYPGALVLAADTMVVLDGRAYGKPAGIEEARQMLRQLRGRTHSVFTAVHLIHRSAGVELRGFSRTLVTMRQAPAREIDAYVRSGEVQDKAGAYAIQGAGSRLVSSINGPYDNVVGMPLQLVRRLLRKAGVSLRAGDKHQ